MKRLFASVILVLVIVFATMSCGQEATPSKEEKTKQLLTSGVWLKESVTVDGIDYTSLYGAIELQFSDGKYTAKNGGAIWPLEGTWNFKESSQADVIIRDGAVEMRINEVTATNLNLEFMWSKTTVGQGRSNSIQGDHVFKFKIQK